MQTHLTLDWGDGSYDFKLTWVGCAEIERKSDATIQAVYERVLVGSASLSDVSEIIRQGLLGGSGGLVDGQQVEPKPAIINALVERYVTGAEARPFTESWMVAKMVMHAFMVGHPSAQKKSEDLIDSEPAETASTPKKSSPTAP